MRVSCESKPLIDLFSEGKFNTIDLDSAEISNTVRKHLEQNAASEIKRMVSFEVLDQSKTSKKSNKTKNPSVQKIVNHQPLSELFGFVAVINAEKVILDRIQEKDGQITLIEGDVTVFRGTVQGTGTDTFRQGYIL